MYNLRTVVTKSLMYIGAFLTRLLIVNFSEMYDYIDSNYYVSYLDVGQGDSALITNRQVNVLIDGGGYSYLNHKLDSYMRNDSVIEYLVITHPHDDHYLGIFDLLKRYTIKNVIINPICINSNLYIELINSLSQSTFMFSRYVEFSYNSNKELSVKNVLKVNGNMLYEGCSQVTSNLNNASVVTEFNYDDKVYLFMGDAEKSLELELIRKNILPRDVYILKAGHHCSDTSSSDMFLEHVSPRYVVCSYGKDNEYGHPSINLIRKFEGKNIKVLSTEKLGDIIINL